MINPKIRGPKTCAVNDIRKEINMYRSFPQIQTIDWKTNRTHRLVIINCISTIGEIGKNFSKNDFLSGSVAKRDWSNKFQYFKNLRNLKAHDPWHVQDLNHGMKIDGLNLVELIELIELAISLIDSIETYLRSVIF
jgi:hypothetical protein